MHLYARYAREQVMDRISIYRKSMDLVNALCLDRIGSFCYLLDMLSGGVHSASVEEVERVVRNLDKEGCITEIKREGVYEMCEACNGIWKRYLGREYQTSRMILVDRGQNAAMDVWCVPKG